MMYETADMSIKNKELLTMTEEMRHLPESVACVENDWATGMRTYIFKDGFRMTRRINSNVKSTATTAKKPSVPAVKKATAPVVKTVPVARKKPVRVSEITAIYKDTLEKTERDIIRNKQRLNQIENDIRAMQRMGAPEYSTLMVQKKKDREEVRGKIEKLQGIRDRCRKQLGMK